MSKKRAEFRFQSIVTVIIVLLLLISFVPIALMIMLSFKTNAEVYSNFFALPKSLNWANYSSAVGLLGRNMFNTVAVVAIAVVLTLILSVMGGYVFARMNFPGKNLLYVLLMALMMIPGILYLAPNYALVQQYGIFNTWWALILPWISGGQILGIVLCRNSVEALPTDLFEAAKLEGCGEIRTLLYITVPLVKPILSTIAVLKMVDYYNDFIWPMMVIESNAKQVITVAVRVFAASQSAGGGQIGPMFAGYVIATVPVFILFLFTSRLYMEGMTAGAVKG
ncbi:MULTISPECIES: carbohydrate ABC transporter permease [Clostridia]|uniref:carbohydrate ABC transporter permease n=1 Tax=Clostridia TaxID=186801 RepID=UPI001570348E|nr:MULTISPECIES: carbohydrate ABC transporter permease [Blautia]MCB6328573.1 carbohydrate ABC transporter permease [Blautia faecis]MCB6626678.1 carbohydrate ABC transporter permease [Blautia sp. 210702-DFI.1.159]NSG93422.1 carbohydrate ABC transporter permease [Blautia faecis]